MLPLPDPFGGNVNNWIKTRTGQGGSSSSQPCLSWMNLPRQHFGFEAEITHRRIYILLEMLLAEVDLPEKPQPVFGIMPWIPRLGVSLSPFHAEYESWDVFQAA